MELARNPFTHAIAAGDKQVGLWISLASPFVADLIAPAGYDRAGYCQVGNTYTRGQNEAIERVVKLRVNKTK